VVTGQMIADLVIIGLGLRVIVGAVQRGPQRRPGDAGPAPPQEQARAPAREDHPVVNPGVIGAAAGLFAATNIDDIVVLSLFFAQGAGHRGSAARVVAGQYLGFTAILAVAIAAAVGATFLPGYPCPAPLDHQGITGLVTEPAPASGK